MFRHLGMFVLIGSAATWIAPFVHGQAAAINGEILGSITDASGAAVAGAAVQIVNQGTGFKQATRTSDSGLYRFSLVPLGTYELTTQAVGFADVHQTGIVVNAGAAVSVNLALQVAGASTRVEVTAAAA